MKYDFFDDKDDKKMLQQKKEVILKWMRPKQFPISHQRGKITLMIVKQLFMLPQEGKMKMKQTKKYIRNQSLKKKPQMMRKNLSKVNQNRTKLISKFQNEQILRR